MDDDSLTFGSDAAGATPGSYSILAQPPLQGEGTPQETGQGEAGDGGHSCSTFFLQPLT
jgi:SWI/SNF related-matrix-associated actin-dependent regulator of chromatin subfamily C